MTCPLQKKSFLPVKYPHLAKMAENAEKSRVFVRIIAYNQNNCFHFLKIRLAVIVRGCFAVFSKL